MSHSLPGCASGAWLDEPAMVIKRLGCMIEIDRSEASSSSCQVAHVPRVSQPPPADAPQATEPVLDLIEVVDFASGRPWADTWWGRIGAWRRRRRLTREDRRAARRDAPVVVG